jgi:hypothetical protein
MMRSGALILYNIYTPAEMAEKASNINLEIDEFLERKRLENEVLKKILKLLEEEKQKTETEVSKRKSQNK